MKIANRRINTSHLLISLALILVSVLFLQPIAIVLMNSFKSKLYILDAPFALPDKISFFGLENYTQGLAKTGFFSALGWSLFITVFSVACIVLFTSMTAWYITRRKGKLYSALYYMFVFAMIVPFQMVMFPMTKIANLLHLDSPLGIWVIYLGFGAGQSVFLYSGFIRSIPLAVEEAAIIDGCNPLATFSQVVFPMLKPISVTVAIINAMWIWNDYLLPSLVIGTDYKTIPVAIQYLRGGYGSIDMGYMMAMIIMAVIPIIIFYFSCQKYIIKGVIAGSIKG